MHIFIYFIGGDPLTLNTINIPEGELRQFLEWFKDQNGSEVKTIKYNMKGIAGEYIFSRKNIAYIKTQND